MTGLQAAQGPGLAVWAADNPFLTVEFFLAIGLLISVLLGGAVVFYFVDRWRKRQLSPGRETTDTLTMFRAMFERGELTEAEYRRVRDRVAARMREEVALPAVEPPAGGGAVVAPPESRESPPAGPAEPRPENPSG